MSCSTSAGSCPVRWPAAGFLIGASCLAGCAPTINLATPKPITLDIGGQPLTTADVKALAAARPALAA